jgi:hypothetical protein
MSLPASQRSAQGGADTRLLVSAISRRDKIELSPSGPCAKWKRPALQLLPQFVKPLDKAIAVQEEMCRASIGAGGNEWEEKRFLTPFPPRAASAQAALPSRRAREKGVSGKVNEGTCVGRWRHFIWN